MLCVHRFARTDQLSVPEEIRDRRYTVEFECDLPLAAGEMNFAIGITSDEKNLYYAEGIGALSISEIALTTQPHRASGCGLLITTTRPEIQPLRE